MSPRPMSLNLGVADLLFRVAVESFQFEINADIQSSNITKIKSIGYHDIASIDYLYENGKHTIIVFIANYHCNNDF